jgi:hypothetical protein
VLSSLLTAFRQQYPQGSLTSDLLTIYDGLFVVRVAASANGGLLAQSLAAHHSLETAEDTACQRALVRLGLTDTPTHAKGQPALALPQPASPETATPAAVPPAPDLQSPVQPSIEPDNPSEPDDEPVAAAPPAIPVQTIPTIPTAASPEPSATKPPETDAADAKLPEPQAPNGNHPIQPPTLATPPIAKAPPADSAPPAQPSQPDPMALPATGPIDLSDIIAQTDVELQRLGWDVHKGREFLERTYGKRSRHDLSDEELLEFLLYLETQTPEWVN